MARGTVLVGQGSRIEATQNLPDVRFLDIRFLFLSFAYASTKRECNAVSTIADESWQYRRDINEDHDTAEAKFLQPSMRLRYNYYVQLVVTRRDWMRVPNLKFWSARQRGGWKLVVHITVYSTSIFPQVGYYLGNNAIVKTANLQGN